MIGKEVPKYLKISDDYESMFIGLLLFLPIEKYINQGTNKAAFSRIIPMIVSRLQTVMRNKPTTTKAHSFGSSLKNNVVNYHSKTGS